MLRGNKIRLRPVQENDLSQLYQFHTDVVRRGEYYPKDIISEPAYRNLFQQTGFWEKNDGMLVIVNDQDDILGHISFFETVSYLDEIELSYIIYSDEYRGQGITTEAVSLLTAYLFDVSKYNRIRLIIHPDNMASKRVAEKCNYQYEGIARGAWFNKGRSQDVAVYAIIREDHYQDR